MDCKPTRQRNDRFYIYTGLLLVKLRSFETVNNYSGRPLHLWTLPSVTNRWDTE